MKLRWKVSFKALIFRANTLGLLTAEQAKSGFTYLNRKGFTKHEELDELIPMESPILVQRAIKLLDYGTWKRALTAAGLTPEMVARQYMLDVPSSPVRLVGGNVA